MGDLQKFRRRLIRSVSRLLYKEKKSPEDVWKQLNIETKCDCKALWERMKSLTLKKLNRLLVAEDKSDNLAPIARMTLTDWLLFDLVLVHENIDFIGEDRLAAGKVEYKPLIDLYSLVQRFNIEELKENDLADAWTAATMLYNRQGRQCSPMLLQKRWFQLKSHTRQKFYKFWFEYRGIERYLETAQNYKPTALQMAIAKTYPDVVCEPFVSWEERIDNGTIILPETFEAKMGIKSIPETLQKEKAPDVVLIEPQIETIDLESEENRNIEKSTAKINTEQDSNNTESIINAVAVKLEPPMGDCLSNVKIVETSHVGIELQCLENMEQLIQEDFNDSIKNVENSTREEEPKGLSVDKSVNEASKTVVDTQDSVKSAEEIDDDEFESMEEIEMDDEEKVCEEIECEETHNMPKDKQRRYNEVEIGPCQTENVSLEVEESDHKNYGSSQKLREPILSTHDSKITNEFVTINPDSTDVAVVVEAENETGISEITEKTDQVITCKDSYKNNKAILPNDSHELTIGIMSTENPVCKTNEDYNETLSSDDPKVQIFNEQVASACSSKSVFPEDNLNSKSNDEDDLLNLIVQEKADHYINVLKTKMVEDPSPVKMNQFDFMPLDLDFVDDGIEFVDEGIEFTDDIKETSGKFLDDIKQGSIEEEARFDVKLLLTPVVYTKRLDDMSVFINRDFTLNDIDLINCVTFESKPVSKQAVNANKEKETLISNKKEIALEEKKNIIEENTIIEKKITEESKIVSDENDENDDLFHSTILSEDDDSDSIDDSFKVKSTSYLLKKLKTRSYNPIQLCKNPDFNTRLRRLNFGFFGYPRNRQLLNACKPLTIDVHKAFEEKLIDGTLYLKPSSNKEITLIEEKKINHLDMDETVTSVVPTAMPVQSLIDSSKVDIQELLPSSNISTSINNTLRRPPPSDSIIAERNKVISLPDKEKIRQINQQLKVAEVSPIVQNTLEASTSVITLDSPTKQITEPVHPSLTSDSIPAQNDKNETNDCNDKTSISSVGLDNSKDLNVETMSDLQKKKASNKKKKTTPVNWISRSKAPYPFDNTEYLLARDTLSKVLFVLNAEQNSTRENSQRCQNTTISNKKSKDKKEPKRNLKKTKNVVENDESMEVQTANDERIADLASNKPSVMNPKINIVSYKNKNKKRKSYCCWAKKKIEKLDNNRLHINQHTCQPNNCKCCCKDMLSRYSINPVIVVSEDEDEKLQKACESIEKVVRQSQDECEPFLVPAANTVTLANEMIVEKEVVVSSSFVPLPGPPIVPTSGPSVHHTQDLRPDARYFKYQRVQRPRVKQVPCQCNEQSVVINNQQNFLIDGKLTCPYHAKYHFKNKNVNIQNTIRDKVLFLNNKSISDKMQNPIFVGKNKILLTNVKYEKKDEPELSPKSQKLQPPSRLIAVEPLVQSLGKISDESATHDNIVLPLGVQLKLSNSGQLSYSIDPEAVLDDEVLASLPIIVSALQQQIDQNIPQLSSVDSIPGESNHTHTNSSSETNLETNTDCANLMIEQVLDKNSQLTEDGNDLKVIKPQNTVQEQPGIETVSHETEEVAQLLSSRSEELKLDENIPSNISPDTTERNDENVGKTTAIDGDCENRTIKLNSSIHKDKNIVENLEDDQIKSKSTLLSDLMEMSGISAEDTVPVTTEPSLSNIPDKDPILDETPDDNTSTQEILELSLMCSFAHLKYACENDGLFFKLDLETGVLVSINVCLKKNKQAKSGPGVIDLTSDLEDDQQTDKKTLKDFPQDTVAITKEFGVKPLKLFKSIRPTLSNNTKMPRKRLIAATGEPFLPLWKRKKIRSKLSRKNNIEAKIDLVDSDEPIEEEYLVDSTDSDGDLPSPKPLTKRARPIESSEDTSDDEPLSKKASRTKLLQESHEKEVDEVNVEKSPNPKEKIVEIDENTLKSSNKQTLKTTSIENSIATTIMELPPKVTVDSIEMVTETGSDGPTALAFLNNTVSDNSSGDENCILGF